VFEHAPQAIGGLRPGRLGRSWLAVAIVCVSIILLVSLWGLLRPAPEEGHSQPAFVTTPARTTGARSGAGPGAGSAARPGPAATTARPAAREVAVTLRYAGASWTRVTTDGRVAFEGTPGPGQRRRFTARRSLVVALGYPAGVRLTVNGEDLGVPDRSGNTWRHAFTPKSRSLD
jgi:hypothetical protein